MNVVPDSDQLHRIANDDFEILVSAATGRIIRYAKIGGANVLWENPRALETPVVFPGWVNWGGDKVWIWPEEDWVKWNSASQHPPGDPSTGPHQVEVDGLLLRMTSPAIVGYGVRIIREITLEPTSSRVTLVNRLEQVTAPAFSLPVGLWTVTQLPAAPTILAHLSPDAELPGYESFPGTSWPNVERDGCIVTLHRPATPWQKIGLDADQLTVRMGDHLFTAETPAALNATVPHPRWRRAQVFSDPDDSAFRLPEVPAYIEFEFTSPIQQLAVGESLSLTVTWSL